MLRNDVGYTPMKRRGESRAWVILRSHINRHTLKLRKTNHVFVALAGSQNKRPKKPTGITHDAWNMLNGCCSEVHANREPWEKFVKTILFQLWLEKLKSSLRGSQMQRFCPEHLQHFSQNCDLNRSSSTSYVYIFSTATVVIRNFSNNALGGKGQEVIKLNFWSDNRTERQLWGKGTGWRAICIEMIDETSLFRNIMQKLMWDMKSQVSLNADLIFNLQISL